MVPQPGVRGGDIKCNIPMASELQEPEFELSG